MTNEYLLSDLSKWIHTYSRKFLKSRGLGDFHDYLRNLMNYHPTERLIVTDSFLNSHDRFLNNNYRDSKGTQNNAKKKRKLEEKVYYYIREGAVLHKLEEKV